LLQTDKDETSINFMMTDPLPIFKISVNGKEIIVLLDTGGPEMIIDNDFAKEIGATVFGSDEGTFAGGRKGQFSYGSVDLVRIGEFDIKNVPSAWGYAIEWDYRYGSPVSFYSDYRLSGGKTDIKEAIGSSIR
jgi:hypothetical protein